MTKITLIALGLILSGFLNAQNRSIKFEHTSWKDLRAKALKENKLIFIDAYTTWCGPCKYMAKYIFTNDTAADFYNANFINAKIDMEKEEGIELAKQYNVACYPTLLFIDGNGNLAHRVAGSMTASQLVELGETAKDNTKNFAWYVKNYEAQKNNVSFLSTYIDAIAGTCHDPSKELAQYFSLQSESDLWSETNWNMIRNYATDLDSREFRFITANQEKLIALHGESEVNEKITVAAGTAMHRVIRANPFSQSAYDRTREQIAGLNVSTKKMILFEAGLQLAKKNKDWKTFSELALADVDVLYANNANELNSVAWEFYENVTDKAALLKAEEWAKKSVELETAYANLDTYAALLYKNGKKSEALSTANKAIEFAKKENYSTDDYKATSDLIKKIKAMK